MIMLYHNALILRNKKWSIRKTAKKLGISVGATSEALKISRMLLIYVELEQCKTREEALDWIRTNVHSRDG